MKIGIFGGTFNPVHKGHMKLAQYAIEELKLDKLLLVPNHISPYKLKQKTISGKDKLNMLSLVLEDKMEVCDFEIKRKNISYTIDTIKYLKNKYKNDELFFLLGSDNLPKLHKWEGIDEIASSVKIAVFKREKVINKKNIKKFNCLLLDNNLFYESSTKYRKGNLEEVDPRVAKYIAQNYLYLDQLIFQVQSARLSKHSVFTAQMAAELARNLKLNPKDAYYAGLMHDFAKEWSEEKSREYIKKYDPSAELEFHELHEYCAYLWLKHEYHLDNDDILHAVRIHTNLDDRSEQKISLFDKIIFVSDKICQGRKFAGVQKLRKIVFENFEEGFKEVIKHVIKFNEDKGVVFSDRQIKIYEGLLK